MNLSRLLVIVSVGLLGCSAREAAVDTTSTTSGAATDMNATQPMASPTAQMQAVLDKLASLGGKPIESLPAAEARRQPTPTDAVKALMSDKGMSTAPDPAVSSVDRTIPGPGGSLPVRIYTPTGATGPLPVVVYYHGGGWVIASKDVYDGGPRGIAKGAQVIVISVDYRQGPENRFPAAHDDAIAAFEWAQKNAGSLKGDPARMALAGESAGGGLAVATAIAVRDKHGPMPLAIVSVYPIAGTDTTTPSYVENANAKPLNRPMMTWFFENYLSSPADRANPRVNLVDASLQGLPPTTIINAQIDPLRSEGEMLAQRLRAAGVAVDQKTYAGVTHEFFGMATVVDEAKDAQQMASAALTKAFSASRAK